MRRLLAAVSFLALVSPALGGIDDVQLPGRRAGLWEITMTGGPMAMTSKNCIDHNTDKAMMLKGMSRLSKMNGTMSITGGGHHFQIKSTATVGDRKMMLTEDISYVSDAEIKTTVHTDFDPPMPSAAAAMNGHGMTIDSKWVGACPAGMQPGDAEIGGHTVHILKDQGQ